VAVEQGQQTLAAGVPQLCPAVAGSAQHVGRDESTLDGFSKWFLYTVVSTALIVQGALLRLWYIQMIDQLCRQLDAVLGIIVTE
jgi:hypothetical protein